MFALPEHYFDPAAPIAFDQHTRSWPLSAYDDVLRLLTDRETFSGAPLAPTGPTLDAAALHDLEPAIRELTTRTLKDLTGTFDLAPVARQLADEVAQLTPAPADPDTAAAAVGNSLLFLTHHGQLAPAAADPHSLAHAVDEVLRWYPPTPVIAATAQHDIAVGTVTIPAGAAVTARLSAANRDPKRFPDPATFDIARQPNRHLSLGRGTHYHPAAALIRVQMAITVQQAARLLPELRWDAAQPLHRHPGPVHYLTRAQFTA